jgi:iron complex transport system ATP-binding protein
MIRVDDLSVSLGDTPVLDDVSMAVDDGELVGLVGANGAGKTTLLRVLSGVLAPDSGVVTVGGDAVGSLGARERSRRIAVVPQDTTLNFDFSVRDVVAMGRTPHRGRFERASSEDADAVESAMERTTVTEFADTSIRAVSGGERQRVVLARALAQEAPVLLLDEPTASLDVNHQIRTLDLVADLVAEGRTAVAAIHDLSLAARYCDRLVVLADGDVVASGPPERVLDRSTVGDAFDADAAVVADPITGTPAVTPLSSPNRPLDATVHVVGTGSDAGSAIATLAAAGATVTAGPVPAGDAAATAATGVDAAVVTVPPFEDVPVHARGHVREHVASADVTVLAGTVHDRALTVLPDETAVVATDTAVFHGDGERAESIETIESVALADADDHATAPDASDGEPRNASSWFDERAVQLSTLAQRTDGLMEDVTDAVSDGVTDDD